ncbi:thioredoxin [Francisella frigiditurris]|uniref:Thioredoxin n=1 Tax=Francisella frigiditurris TaxID=1542390 RepID=A0A1J0KUV5_9GAMM|nr:thioredoxin [Francisella frigiditurris]APC97414.1 thioredoxin [Francisella frigiditurris]
MGLGKVITANENSFETVLEKAGSKPVLVDFFAEWCGPCKMQEPILDKLSKDYDGAVIVKINVDENQSLAAKFRVRSIPTMIIFKNGKEVETMHGVKTQSQLEDKLNSHK